MNRVGKLTTIIILLAAGIACAQSPESAIHFLPAVTEQSAQPAAPANAAESIAPGPVASCPSQQFRLEDLESIAMSNNPTVACANARVQAAQANWTQVGLYPNPTGGYSTAEIGEEGTAGQQGGMIGQEIVLGHKLKLNRAIAAKEVRQAEHEREVQTLRVLNDVRTQFYNVLIAQQKVALAERLSGIGDQGVSTTEKLFKAQEVSRSDILQARIESNSARILAENVRNEYESSWRTLAAVMGMPTTPPAPLIGDVHAGLSNIAWDEVLYSAPFVPAPKFPPHRQALNGHAPPSIAPRRSRFRMSISPLPANTTMPRGAISSAYKR